MENKYGSPMVREGAIGNGNRVVAESIVRERKGERLIETIEYYLNELDRLENELDRLERGRI
jgi:hypothetical protein